MSQAPRTTARVADHVAHALKAAGCTGAFGMPGGEVATLLDGFQRAGLRFVLARHETAAALMAAGAWSQGEPVGLLVTTLGPGIANAVNGLADAVQERVPLLVLTGVVDRRVRTRYTHQILDQRALLAAVTKGSFELDAVHPTATIARALQLARRAPAGPVHLDLAPDVAAQLVDDHPFLLPHPLLPGPNSADTAFHDLLTAAAQWQRPVVIAGWQAAVQSTGAAVRRLADAGVPIITTYKAKGLLDEAHPLAMGGAGLSPRADQALLALLTAADGVLLLGYDPIEMRQNWLDPFPSTAQVVDCADYPVDHAMHRWDHQVIGPLPALADAFAAAMTTRETPLSWALPHETRATLTAAFAPPAAWGPHAVFAALQTEIDADDTVLLTVDSGAHRILLSQQLRLHHPKQLLQSAGFCTMGAAVPLAAGAKWRQPTRRVIAVLGDGGLEMGLGELGTLRDQGLAVTVVVLQDASLALIELKQRQSQLATVGVDLGRTDLAAVARAFGGVGATVRDADALAAALATARTATVFTVIACEINASDYLGQI